MKEDIRDILSGEICSFFPYITKSNPKRQGQRENWAKSDKKQARFLRGGRFDKVCSRKRSVFQPVSNRTRCCRENPAADLTNNKKIAMIIQ